MSLLYISKKHISFTKVYKKTDYVKQYSIGKIMSKTSAATNVSVGDQCCDFHSAHSHVL